MRVRYRAAVTSPSGHGCLQLGDLTIDILAPLPRPGLAHCCRVRKFAKRRISGSPRPASGRGAGGEGHSRGRSCVEICGVSSAPRPPHPQPFSPAKPGEKGARGSVARRHSKVTQIIQPFAKAPDHPHPPPLSLRTQGEVTSLILADADPMIVECQSIDLLQLRHVTLDASLGR